MEGLALHAPELLDSHLAARLSEAADCALGPEQKRPSEVEVYSIKSWAARAVQKLVPENLDEGNVVVVCRREYWQGEANRFAAVLLAVRRQNLEEKERSR